VQGNRPPIIRSARIVPATVQLNRPVTVEIDSEDADGDSVTYRYEWLANGQSISGQTGGSLVPKMLKRSDVLAAVVTPMDGKTDGRPFKTPEVSIANTPPEVLQVQLDPPDPHAGDRLHVVVQATDLDRDAVEFTYRWARNGRVVQEGDAADLDTAGFARGDAIVVEITPSDSADKGASRAAEPIILGNNPPKITSVPAGMIAGGLYEYVVTASDPDNDPLTYTLQTAPPGMRIDDTSGRIQWQITAKMRGPYHVRVGVEDGQGGRAFQEFDLSPTPPS
jgi:hypothetical protein